MGFLCKNTITTPEVSIDEVYEQICNRKYGLSNVNNVDTELGACFEDFTGPDYQVSGTTKPTTGLTSTCTGTTDCYAVYNISELDYINLSFNLSGSTDYTGYTGNFCYKLFNRGDYVLSGDSTQDLTSVTEMYGNCFQFSGITSSTINETILTSGLKQNNNDVLLRTYYEFKFKECTGTTLYYPGDDDDGVTGSSPISADTISTWNPLSITEGFRQPNLFNYDKDWYFIYVLNPEQPGLVTPVEDLLGQTTLRQDFYSPNEGDTQIPLNFNPIGHNILLFINGIALTQYRDFDIVVPENAVTTPPIIQLKVGTLTRTDSVKIVYLTGPNSLNRLENGNISTSLFNIEQFQVTGFTTNISASTTNIVNVNTTLTPNTQEIYLQENFSRVDDIILFINGVSLVEGIEFHKSSSSDNRLILNPNVTSINLGDSISIWYFKERGSEFNDLGTLDSDSVTIEWTSNNFIQPNLNEGLFTVEIKEKGNPWTTLYTSGTTEHISDAFDYSLTFDNLTLGLEYEYRVMLEKTYKSQLDNDVITRSYSSTGRFNTLGDELVYSY